MSKDLTIVTTPYDTAYARYCMQDSIKQRESPFSTHLVYGQPGLLKCPRNDIQMWKKDLGSQWIRKADKVAVYLDRGLNEEMWGEIQTAQHYRKPIEIRTLNKEIIPINKLWLSGTGIDWRITIKDNYVVDYKPKTNSWMQGLHVKKLLKWAFNKGIYLLDASFETSKNELNYETC